MEVIFQNVQYIVTVASTRGEALSVSVECKHDANRWRGDFSAKCTPLPPGPTHAGGLLVSPTCLPLPAPALSRRRRAATRRAI